MLALRVPVLLLAASLAAASPLAEKKASLQACVQKVLGANATQHVVVPSDGYYTDARLGEKIQ